MTKQFQHDRIFEGSYVLVFFKVKELHLGIQVQGDSRQLMETVRMLMLVATSRGFLAAFMA